MNDPPLDSWMASTPSAAGADSTAVRTALLGTNTARVRTNKVRNGTTAAKPENE